MTRRQDSFSETQYNPRWQGHVRPFLYKKHRDCNKMMPGQDSSLWPRQNLRWQGHNCLFLNKKHHG